MGDLKFSSLNVRGLGEVSKRKEIFNWLRKKKFSIYMLQEVHCTEKNIHLWTAEWGYKALFSCCASNKAGTCILFNNNFHLQITKTRSDPNGRFIICDICINGISTIRSLMKDANKPLSYEEFQNKYGLKACPLAFGGIIATLKNLRKRFKENIDSPEKDEIEPFIKIFLKAKKPSNLTYKILVATKSEAPETSQAKWHEDCDLEKGEFDWKRAFQSTKICTKSTKLIIFQFKFLHRRLPTNSFLYKINVKDSDRCSFCEKETETLLHLFWHCNQTTRFWESFFKWLQTSLCTQKGNKLDMTIALGLKPDTSNAKLQINFSCLMSRYCIWVCKLKNEIPNLSHFLHLMNKSYEIEKNDPNSSSEKWKPLLGHLSN